MIEAQRIVGCQYCVRETNRLGSPRSVMMTTDYWQALSDLLVKCYRPVGFPPGVGFGDNGVSLVIASQSLPLDDFDLEITADFYFKGQKVRSVSIETSISRHKVGAFYSSDTVRFYQEQDYTNAVLKMENRLKSFTKNQHDIGYIVAIFAATDRAHPFWKPAFFGRARGLSM